MVYGKENGHCTVFNASTLKSPPESIDEFLVTEYAGRHALSSILGAKINGVT